MTVEPRVPAVGGTRTVPAPDPIAADYLLLALRLDQHLPGLIDAYFGPARIKATVDMEPRRAPADLRDDAASLRERVAGEVAQSQRRTWLTAQLLALEAQAAVLAGDPIVYEEQVARAFDFVPRWVPEAVLDDAARSVDELLPGDGDLSARIATWDASLEIPPERRPLVLDWLLQTFRIRAAELFGLPSGERLRVTYVRNQPWSAYNWYDGGLQSRVDVNTDLPTHLPGMAQTVAHEAYPGHHLEHAWKEADLVERGRVECSALTINTPECFISEGLANVGFDFVSPPHERIDLLTEVFQLAGIPGGVDRVRRREIAERAVALLRPREILRTSRINAALMLHGEAVSRDEAVAYLERAGRYPRNVAEKRLEFIDHPLWRTYIFVYSEGEALLREWLDAVPEADRPGRFARLLHEQLTPGTIREELESRVQA
jgi:hypothetical protein